MLTVTDIRVGKLPSAKLLKKLFFIRDYGLARIKYEHVIFKSQMNRLRDQNYDFTQLSRYRSVYIETLSRFYGIERKHRSVKPTKSIQSAVDACTAKYSSHTVGVHVRRTDHCTMSPYSSTQAFIDTMNAEVKQNTETKFYLATDSPEIMSQFIKLFKDRIIWRSKDYSRNSERGIQDALVDLLCLSKTQKIIGSYKSSFSRTAAQLSDIPAIYMKPEQTGVKV
jgi:hypothetical protein